MPITPSIKIIPKVLEIFILESNHPTELIVLLLIKSRRATYSVWT